jgi:hypothetical protein
MPLRQLLHVVVHAMVVVFAHLIAEDDASGAPLELETTHVISLSEGRAVSLQVYRDRSEALQASGLRA